MDPDELAGRAEDPHIPGVEPLNDFLPRTIGEIPSEELSFDPAFAEKGLQGPAVFFPVREHETDPSSIVGFLGHVRDDEVVKVVCR